MAGTSKTSKSLASCLVVALLAPAAAFADEGHDFFENKIRPVLVEHCYGCHSAEAQQKDKLKGGLLLDTRMGIREGGESGPAVVPGKGDESVLLSAIRHESLEMPPKGKLPDEVVADFAKWIDMGAPDPRDGRSLVRKDEIDVAAGREFWSFRPLRSATAPEVKSAWARTDIDRFVAAERDQAGLQAAADAAPRVLVRRLYFDLVGLAPTPEEVTHFKNAAASDRQAAIEQLVDRLLDSPHFGERWGRHWLDVARYGETSGGTKNGEWPDAWRYRDYVIRSLNQDKPYDLFVREQIAGDLLESDSESLRTDRIIATGLLAMGANKDNSTRMEIIGEQLDTVGRAVLGVAIGCARCHDHKFDPIPTADFYAMAGILQNAEPKDQTSHVSRCRHLVKLDKAQINQYKDYVGELKKHNSAIAKGRDRIVEIMAKKGLHLDQFASLEENVAALDGGDRNKAEQSLDEIRQAEEALEELRRKGVPQAPLAIAVEETGIKGKFRNTQVHIRGNEDVLGDEVPRNALQMLTPVPLEIGEEESGRRRLAELVSTHPLTARVFANRVWHHLFGVGLVRTVDNFGTLGERPSHPELLEYLARRLVESDWSTKSLIREVVLSRTYQLAADEEPAALKIDPDNRLLWRHTPRRRDAEALRDAILAAAGTLELASPDAWQQLNYHGYGQDAETVSRIPHRAVYLPVIRGFPPDIFAAFNFPPPDLVVGRRETSSVPTQALFAMNSPLVMRQSQSMAQRLIEEVSATDARIDRAFQLALGRSPTGDELQRAAALVASFASDFESTDKQEAKQEIAERQSWAVLCQSLLASAEFRFIE
ncbi:MAG: PSD1 and planctomycete cytochrome C domain-containing protein [Pirellulaceae bacterium]